MWGRIEDVLREVKEAAKRREETERARAKAGADLAAAIRRAQKAGATVTPIGRELGVSHQRVYGQV